MPKGLTTEEEIADATLGFNALFNNELIEAKRILSNDNSSFHQVGLGLTAFLQAALGLEDQDLYAALTVLVKAETAALASKASSSSDQVFGDGLHYKLLVGDAVLCQALIHVLTESYLEFLKAIFKLNRAYKAFSQVHKIVYPAGVTEDDSLETIITNLNHLYRTKLAESRMQETGGMLSMFGWGKKRSIDPSLRPSASSTTLPSLEHLSLKSDNTSVPNSRPASLPESASVGPTGLPTLAWEKDTLSTLVISGSSFGQGLFGLIFSLLPPKLKKAIGWLGFSNSNRAVALKLLTLASMNGNDVHGYFASLALLTYYGLILLMSGYQSDESFLIGECEKILDHICVKFPNGTLWILNRAKISRMKRDTKAAITILEAALDKVSTFRQADSLLVFELSWCYLSERRGIKAADSFLRMMELSTWSHSTYVFIAAGALLDLPLSERTPEIEARITHLFESLPALFNQKRIMGDPPTSELFIARKLAFYKAKYARWVVDGRAVAGTHFWQVIKVSPSSEMGHFWSTNGRASPASLSEQITHLSAFTPLPLFSPTCLPPRSSIAAASRRRSSTVNSRPSVRSAIRLVPQIHSPTDELDSNDELAVRELLLGALWRSSGELETARAFLESVLDREEKGEILDESWVGAFARFELAIVGCDEAAKKAPMLEEEEEIKDVWTTAFSESLALLEALLTPGPEYDLRSRLESRAMMLKDEIGLKKKSLGIVV